MNSKSKKKKEKDTSNNRYYWIYVIPMGNNDNDSKYDISGEHVITTKLNHVICSSKFKILIIVSEPIMSLVMSFKILILDITLLIILY